MQIKIVDEWIHKEKELLKYVIKNMNYSIKACDVGRNYIILIRKQFMVLTIENGSRARDF